MTRDQLTAVINQKITSNGNRTIKGSDLNTILNELLSQVPIINPSQYYTKEQIDDMLGNIAGPGSQYKFVEEDVNVTGSMINGMQVSFFLNEVLNTDLERTVFYNGVFISNSMSVIDSNNQLMVNLAPLGMVPKVSDFVTVKYYKI